LRTPASRAEYIRSGLRHETDLTDADGASRESRPRNSENIDYGTAHSQLQIIYLGRCTLWEPGASRICPAPCAQTQQAPQPRVHRLLGWGDRGWREQRASPKKMNCGRGRTS
jgi:hypothetical protein